MIAWTTVLCSWAYIHNCPRENTCARQAQCKHGSAGEVPRGGWRAEGLSSVEIGSPGGRRLWNTAGFLLSFFLLLSLPLSLWSSSFPPVPLSLVFFPLHWWATGITGVIVPSSHCLSSGRQELSCAQGHVHQASRPRNFPSRYRNSEATDMYVWCEFLTLNTVSRA